MNLMLARNLEPNQGDSYFAPGRMFPGSEHWRGFSQVCNPLLTWTIGNATKTLGIGRSDTRPAREESARLSRCPAGGADNARSDALKSISRVTLSVVGNSPCVVSQTARQHCSAALRDSIVSPRQCIVISNTPSGFLRSVFPLISEGSEWRHSRQQHKADL